MPLEVGQIVDGKYRVIRVIGEGGMGVVYEGENTRIHRRVAIKVLHPEFMADAEAVKRFEREAQAAGHIGNDHILEVLDLGSLPSGESFMVMEYLDGEPLTNRIRQYGRLSARAVCPIAEQVLTGLAAAHQVGIVHRDLKPDNIFILKEKAGRRDFVKIIDFGVSKFAPAGAEGLRMTRTGTVMGTPYYMSPEQASGSSAADHRSDVYAVGVILYEAVTGKVPFDADSFNQLMFKIVLSDVPQPLAAAPDLDPAFASIVSKAMARDPNHRFQSCEEFQHALREWKRAGSPVSVPPQPQAAPELPLVSRDHRSSAPATWASSQFKVPKKSTVPLMVGVVGVALLAAGIIIYSVFGSEPKAESVATQPLEQTLPQQAEAKPSEPVVEPVPSASVAEKKPPSPIFSAKKKVPQKRHPPVSTSPAPKAKRPLSEPSQQSQKSPAQKSPKIQRSPKPSPSPGIDFGY